jgi:hypothetical protein
LKEGLDGADDLAAGGSGLKQLPDKALECQAQAEDAVTAVGAFIFTGEQLGREQCAQLVHQEGEMDLAQGLGASAPLGG